MKDEPNHHCIMKFLDLRLALRVLYRQKFYSAINIIGFSLGLGVFLSITVFLLDQYSYDKWPRERENIYRIEKPEWGVLGTAYGPYLKRNFPEVEDMCRISTMRNNTVLENEGNLFSIPDIIYADSTVFDIFSFNFIHGNPQTALNDPYSIVLTSSLAETIFGDTDVTGQVLSLNSSHKLKVTGVIEDVNHFHIKTAGLIPFHLLGEFYKREGSDYLYEWGSWNHFNYLLISPGTDIGSLEKKINQGIEQEVKQTNGWDIEADFFLRPLSNIYFANDIKHTAPALSGQKQTVRLFLAVAVFILLIAIVNFVNLSTARSSIRAREVGICRLLGSNRSGLIKRFLFESVIITALAVILALVLLEFSMPWFKGFAGISTDLYQLNIFKFSGILLAGVLITGFLSGFYPSVYLTAFAPIDVLKGNISHGKKGALMRKTLIVFQFIISIVLIISTFIISDQLKYMQEKDLGINITNTVTFQIDSRVRQKWDSFRARLEQHHAIDAVARSAQIPGQITWQESAKGNSDEDKQYTLMNVDAAYLPMVDIELAAGRLFSEDLPSEHKAAVILNENAVRYFGYEGNYDDIIGQNFGNNIKIIGVSRDFHFNSVQNPIGPLVILWREDFLSAVSIKINQQNFSQAIDYIEKVWYEFSPSMPFTYKEVDVVFDSSYRKEKQLNQIFMIFAGFAIIIACLGLFGLASFMAERKTKEMAVRKVMGAGTLNLVMLMINDFIRLVFISFIIAAPLAWLMLDYWLDSFPYHTLISWMPFLIALLAAMTITIITVSYHAIRVSGVNPGLALKYE